MDESKVDVHAERFDPVANTVETSGVRRDVNKDFFDVVLLKDKLTTGTLPVQSSSV
jgi:hypothetical protein